MISIKLILVALMIPVLVVLALYRLVEHHFFGGKKREQQREAARLAEVDDMLKKMRSD